MKHYYIVFLSVAFLLSAYERLKAQVTVNISVDATKPGYKIKEDFLGLSMEQKTLTTGLGCCGTNGTTLSFFEGKPGVGNSRLINLFHNLSSSSVLRMGGGTVDKMTWMDANRGFNDSLNLIYHDDADKLFAFLRQVGWKAIYSVNLGNSYINGVGHPSNAASEASYIYNNYSDLLNSISIGNEPEGFASQGFRSSTYGPSAYMPEYLTYYDAIKSANSSIPISGGDLSEEPANKDWTTQYTASINNNTGNTRPLTALNIHGYALSNNMNTLYDNGWLVNRLMNYTMPGYTSSPLVVNLPFLTQSAQNSNVPLRFSECGSSASDTSKVSNKYVTALWALDYCYTLATAKLGGVNFHGGGGSPYSVMFWGGGNNNLSLNPLAATYPVGAIYYGLLAFVDGAKNMSLLPVTPQTTTGVPRASYYATISDDGKSAKVTIINKDTTNTINAVVNLAGQTITAASYRTLNFTNSIFDLAANTFYGNAQVANDGTFTPKTGTPIALTDGNNFAVSVLPMTAAVVALNLQSSILPVGFLSFTGKPNANNVQLDWSTATETNNAGFEIQKSIDGNNFTKIGFANGSGTTVTPSNYKFIDSATQQGEIYFYRLKQINVDGQFVFSNTIQVRAMEDNDYRFVILPNPNNGNFSITTENPSAVNIKMYNISGDEISIKTVGSFPGKVDVRPVSQLATGIYFVHFLSASDKLMQSAKILVRQ